MSLRGGRGGRISGESFVLPDSPEPAGDDAGRLPSAAACGDVLGTAVVVAAAAAVRADGEAGPPGDDGAGDDGAVASPSVGPWSGMGKLCGGDETQMGGGQDTCRGRRAPNAIGTGGLVTFDDTSTVSISSA